MKGSAWDRFLERLPMRMRATMREGDAGIAIRSLCVEIDELRDAVKKLAPKCGRCVDGVCEEDGEICGICNGSGVVL